MADLGAGAIKIGEPKDPRLERDVALIEQARDDAELLLQTDPAAAAAHLARWLGGKQEFIKA